MATNEWKSHFHILIWHDMIIVHWSSFKISNTLYTTQHSIRHTNCELTSSEINLIEYILIADILNFRFSEWWFIKNKILKKTYTGLPGRTNRFAGRTKCGVSWYRILEGRSSSFNGFWRPATPLSPLELLLLFKFSRIRRFRSTSKICCALVAGRGGSDKHFLRRLVSAREPGRDTPTFAILSTWSTAARTVGKSLPLLRRFDIFLVTSQKTLNFEIRTWFEIKIDGIW